MTRMEVWLGRFGSLEVLLGESKVPLGKEAGTGATSLRNLESDRRELEGKGGREDPVSKL